MLADAEYIEIINNTIEQTVVDNPNTEAQLLWDTMKMNIRGQTIKFSSRKKRAKNNLLKALERRLSNLENEYKNNPDPELLHYSDLVKIDIDHIITENTRASILRSKALWHEHGERSSKYFLNLEKRNYNKKTINRLRMSDGNFITGQQHILTTLTQFYKELYTSKCAINLDNNEFFTTHGPKLNLAARTQINDPILSMDELHEALKTTKSGKTPGNDGLPAEFYKIFWPKIKNHLFNAINCAYHNGSLSITQRQGIITLLPKKGKDPLELKNWRPITLLNQDYKLAAKVIANRMKLFLEHVINSDQTGFIKNRYIGENIT